MGNDSGFDCKRCDRLIVLASNTAGGTSGFETPSPRFLPKPE